MRFLDLLNERSIPEWARCYYDYETAKLVINHAKRVFLILEKIRDFKKVIILPQTTKMQESSQETSTIKNEQNEQLVHFNDSFKEHEKWSVESVVEGNKLFFRYHIMNKNVVFLFCQMKLHQLNRKIDKYQGWARRVDKQKPAYLSVLSNVFYEGKMLYRMCEVNLLGYKKVQKKHVKNFSEFQLESPVYGKQRIKRTLEELDTYFVRLQNLYLTTKELYPKKARTQLYEQMEANPLYESIASYFFGLTNGISLSLVVLAIIIFAQSEVDSNNEQFNRDFPVWRAVGYVILYMWAVSINIFVCERFRINYQLVFGLNKMTPRSAFALAISSGFTFLYLTLFIFYLLDLTGLLERESDIIFYFPAMVWAIILGYMFFPLPILNYEGRLYFFKEFFSTLISPFLDIDFNIIFITEQFISVILPFSDMVYTVCYYSSIDLSVDSTQHCQPHLHTAEYFGIIIFMYRLVQSVKYAFQHHNFLWTREMFIVIRSVLNIFMLLVSLLSSVESNLITVWLVCAGPVTLFNYYVDLQWDWGLLEPDSKNSYLRDYLAFDKHWYYAIMIVNLIFRACALLTLSQNIIYELNLAPLPLLFGVAICQIVRRFFWNIIKVERQHVRNCENFTVKTNYEEMEELVQSEVYGYNQQEEEEESESIEAIREREELANLRDEIDRKQQLKEEIIEWHTQQKGRLLQIEQQIDEMYSKRKDE